MRILRLIHGRDARGTLEYFQNPWKLINIMKR